MTNPLLEQWDTPFNTPPFHLIGISHFKPAIEEAIKSATIEINSITENQKLPTFDNTIAALDSSGRKLGEISALLFNLNSAETTKELQLAAQEISPLLVRFSNDVTLNKKLFSRIEKVYSSKSSMNLTIEQEMLLEKKYRSFMLGGAGLDENQRTRFREISEELTQLALKFEENVLDETNAFELHLTDKQDLAGLPDDIIDAASVEAQKRQKKGWVFTLHYPSFIPFMQYSEKRELRKEMLKAYNSRAFHNDIRDNRSIVSRMVNLRLEVAKILGFSNYAEMVLGDRMAEKPEEVNSFLERLFTASHNAALRDFKNTEDFAFEFGFSGKLERWDWAFFSERLKKFRYNIDDEILKPYFALENVTEAIFGLSFKLFGLKFCTNKKIPVYHNDVKTWEVYLNTGQLAAILYLDLHPRTGKNGGAWMTSFREEKFEKGKRIIPLISIVANFSRPTSKKPSLLTFNELTTFLHEFGHALHGMLSECNYESLAGTNVARDFVELPSQFMENWAFEQEWLDTWAVHYDSNEKIPPGMIQKIREASTFNEGYACNRQLGFALLDMAWHTIKEPFQGDVNEFEISATSKTQLFPLIENVNMSCSFSHLFGGEYASGYYGYKWAEVLDADAFQYFREKGIFNKEVADAFRKNILEAGGSDKPMKLYKKFRGREPSFEAFLVRSGLKQ